MRVCYGKMPLSSDFLRGAWLQEGGQKTRCLGSGHIVRIKEPLILHTEEPGILEQRVLVIIVQGTAQYGGPIASDFRINTSHAVGIGVTKRASNFFSCIRASFGYSTSCFKEFLLECDCALYVKFCKLQIFSRQFTV